jgi:DNA-binding transcriptional LysR family regulator
MSETVDLDLIAAFVAVSETHSFTKAAKRLGTTKATISRAIARLESVVGAELVHRTTRNVSLSGAGSALYERAAQHVTALREIIGTLPDAKESVSGQLRLTAPIDVGVIVLPEVIARFNVRHPGVRVEVHLSNERLDLVEDRFDLAIRAGNAKQTQTTLTVRKLGTFAMAVYASPAYVARRGTPRELYAESHDWAVHSSLKCKTTPKLRSNDLLFLRDVLRNGTHVGVLPSFLGEPYAAMGELVRVPGLTAQEAGLVLLYPSSGQVARKITAFRDVLIETLRARPLPA